MKEKLLVIIPARSGSKGIPDKNIKPVAGKPLLFHSIDTAKELNPDRIIVSTNSQKYRDIVNAEYGNEYTPFLRPEEISTDTSPSSDVIIHAIKSLKENYDIILLLEPTHPFRILGQIKDGLNQMVQNGFKSVVSVYKNDQCHPDLAFRKDDDNNLLPFFKSYPNHPRRQSLEPVYFLDGSFYASYIDTYIKYKSFTHWNTLAYEVARWQSNEIDDPEDIDLVEYILKKEKTW
jgi:CMP-N,N'-diacetyllegionaminic acid synthase